MVQGNLPGSTTHPQPEIEAFIPDDVRLAIVIFPGGGYHTRAPHEGRHYAEFLMAHDVACFVVDYRSGTDGFRHPAVLEDALWALCGVRNWLKEQGLVVPVGLMGSSAGGHLAAHATVAAEDYAVPAPDFFVLCYPVIALDQPYGHSGSRANLLGQDASDAQARAVNPVYRMGASTPPGFLWHTSEDQGVPVANSLDVARTLTDHQVPFEIHVYERGGHGLGLNTSFAWGAELVRWLERFAG